MVSCCLLCSSRSTTNGCRLLAVFVFPFLSLPDSLSVSPYVSVSLRLTICVSLSLSDSVFLCLTFSRNVCLRLPLFQTLCQCLTVSQTLVYLCLPFSQSLRLTISMCLTISICVWTLYLYLLDAQGIDDSGGILDTSSGSAPRGRRG